MHPKYYRTLLMLPPPFRMINVMENPPGYLLETHQHDYFHLNCILEGSLVVKTPDIELFVTAGQVFIMPPGILHRLESAGGYRQIGIDILDGADDDRELYEAFSEVAEKPTVAAVPPTVGYDSMKYLLDYPSRHSRQQALHIAEGIILGTIDSLLGSDTECFNARFAMLDSPWKMSLCELSSKLGISRSCLERMAQKSFGCGLGEYCLRLRFSELCRLLRTTDKKLDEIAEELGFCDASHLAVFFRSRAGCTPGQYRNPIKHQE